MIKGYRHTGLVVRDLERSLGFYRDLLGLAVWKQAVETGSYIERVVGVPGVTLAWVKLKAPDGSILELLQYLSHPDPTVSPNPQPANRLGCSHVALTVTNLDQIYQNFNQHGVICKSPPQRSPDGAVKVLYCHDPDGIIVELVEEL